MWSELHEQFSQSNAKECIIRKSIINHLQEQNSFVVYYNRLEALGGISFFFFRFFPPILVVRSNILWNCRKTKINATLVQGYSRVLQEEQPRILCV